MSQTAKAKAKKKQKSNVKKKHQEQWDDLLKLIRTLSRESGLPIGPESNLVIKLFEEYAEDNAPFPPKQMVFSRPVDAEGNWIRILSTALVSKACSVYTQIFTTKSYAGLRALCFWGCDIGDAGTKHLAEIALPLLPLCIKLELIDCGLGTRACEWLASSLKNRRTTHLKILRLDHNTGIGAQGVARLAEGLYFNSLLHTLSLSFCDIGSEGGIFLQNILMTRDIGIKSLNLEGNNLERAGVMALSQGLQGNRSLTSLNLSTNSFGGEGDKLPGEIDAIKYLTAGMCAAKQLVNVNLDGNLVGEAGLAILYGAAVEGLLGHVVELAFTPFAPCDTYKALVDKIESNRPVKTKRKKKRKSTKKK